MADMTISDEGLACGRGDGTSGVAWVLVEEDEDYGDYPTSLLAAYATEEAAQQAASDIESNHKWCDDERCDEDTTACSDDGWCFCCRKAWSVRELAFYAAEVGAGHVTAMAPASLGQ